MFTSVLAVSLVAAGSSYAVAQPAEEAGCVVVVPTTTTPVPAPTTTTVPPPPCPAETTTATTTTTTTTMPVTIEPELAAPPATTTTPPVVEQRAPSTTIPTVDLPIPAAVTTTTVPTTTVPTTTAPTTTVPTTTMPTTTVPTTTMPTTTVLSTTPPPAARAAAPAAALADLLDIVVPSALTGPATIVPGNTWTGTMSMTVLGVGLGGWKSTVSLSNIRGTNTGRVITPTSATYSAPLSVCTAGITGNSAAASVALSGVAMQAKTGGALCLTSWTSTVSIGVPATNVVADTYTATLTHSIF